MKNKTPDAALKRLNSIANDALVYLKDRVVYIDDDGSYNLFGRYIIKRDSAHVGVFSTSGNLIHRFCSMKNAVTWCVFDLRNKFYDCRRIIDLDRQLASINVDINNHTRLCRRVKDGSGEVYEAKLHEDCIKKESVVKLLDGYINISHQWQINRFNANK